MLLATQMMPPDSCFTHCQSHRAAQVASKEHAGSSWRQCGAETYARVSVLQILMTPPAALYSRLPLSARRATGLLWATSVARQEPSARHHTCVGRQLTQLFAHLHSTEAAAGNMPMCKGIHRHCCSKTVT